MSIANFFLKQLIKSKMKDVPVDKQEQVLTMLDKNPDLFKKIAEEVQVKVKSGEDQQSAIMEVISQHREELQKVMGS